MEADYKFNVNWTSDVISDIKKQAETGSVLIAGMGTDKAYPVYWDHILLDACQVTNPSIDPLREPMELRTYLGGKPDSIKIKGTNKNALDTKLSPQLKLDVPILFSAMSYGSISLNTC